MLTVAEVNDMANKSAKDMGYAHGQNGASWIIGPQSGSEAKNWLKMCEDGDPTFYEMLPSPDPENYQLDEIRPFGIPDDLWYPNLLDIDQAYDDGFNEAINERVSQLINIVLDSIKELEKAYPSDRAYKIGSKGAQSWVIDDYVDGQTVKAHMVGDDHIDIMSVTDFVPLDRDEYCGECGAVGCGWC